MTDENRPAGGGAPELADPPRLAARLARALLLLMISVFLVSAGLLALRWSRAATPAARPAETMQAPSDPHALATEIASLDREVRKLTASNARLKRRIQGYRPRGLYIVIDTGANHLYLMRDDQVLRDALVSTGSGMKLADPDKPRSWVFDTPRGEFRVLRKVNEPVWTKPDWAFVEAGEDMPRSWNDRVEEGVLGDYALDLGDGYLIHGTLFERALGLHVTHGCVRVGAKDLEAIFKSVGLGTRVYIV